MQPSEVTELSYLFPSNPTQFQTIFNSINNNNIPTYHSSRVLNPLYRLNITPQVREPNTQQTSLSSNSTSDEADEQQLISIINERKQRRKVSNRESARRSRMRKEKHLDELLWQATWLRNENRQLIDKLNHVAENHDRVLQENARLKEEASELREMIADMQLNGPIELRDDHCSDMA